MKLDRAVRVKFARTSNGWGYVVLAADSLTWLGEGWSAGKRGRCFVVTAPKWLDTLRAAGAL